MPNKDISAGVGKNPVLLINLPFDEKRKKIYSALTWIYEFNINTEKMLVRHVHIWTVTDLHSCHVGQILVSSVIWWKGTGQYVCSSCIKQDAAQWRKKDWNWEPALLFLGGQEVPAVSPHHHHVPTLPPGEKPFKRLHVLPFQPDTADPAASLSASTLLLFGHVWSLTVSLRWSAIKARLHSWRESGTRALRIISGGCTLSWSKRWHAQHPLHRSKYKFKFF